MAGIIGFVRHRLSGGGKSAPEEAVPGISNGSAAETGADVAALNLDESADVPPAASSGVLADAAIAMRDERAALSKEYQESGLLDQFRAAIGDAAKDNPFIDDACLLRFLRADLGDIPKATARLKNTLSWREKTQPQSVICSACAEDSRAHYMHHVGYDKFGRSAIYSCFAMAKDHSVDCNLQHLIQAMEYITSVTPPQVETYVWVCDFHGFGLANCNPKLTLGSNEIFGKHYPERVGTFLFVDAPRIFAALWRNVRPFIDKRTYRKAHFVEGPRKDNGEALRKRLGEIFDQEMVGWFLTEMMENRDPAVTKDKSIDRPPVAEGQHDPRGPPSHITRFFPKGEATTKLEDTQVGEPVGSSSPELHKNKIGSFEVPNVRASQADEWERLETAAADEAAGVEEAVVVSEEVAAGREDASSLSAEGSGLSGGAGVGGSGVKQEPGL